jgi:hypothetical protein
MTSSDDMASVLSGSDHGVTRKGLGMHSFKPKRKSRFRGAASNTSESTPI